MNRPTKPTLADFVFDCKPDWRAASVLFFGSAGVGKTTLGAKAPNLLILDVESRCRGIGGKQIPIDDIGQLDQFIHMLATEEHPYTSILLDGLDVLYDRMLEAGGRVNKDSRSAHIVPTERLTNVIRRYCELPYLTLATAHSRVTDDMHGIVNLPKEARTNIEHAFDVIAHCYRDKTSRKRMFCADEQLVNGKVTAYGKDGVGTLSKPLPMEWAALAKALGL